MSNRAEIVVVPARLEHAFALAPYMREADVAEVRASGQEPLQALLASLADSTVARAALVDDVVIAMFGTQELKVEGELAGALWLLTAQLIERYPLTFFRGARQAITELLEHYTVVGNMIDARYGGALQLVAQLGGFFSSPVEWGPERRLFVPFHFRRSAWAQ